MSCRDSSETRRPTQTGPHIWGPGESEGGSRHPRRPRNSLCWVETPYEWPLLPGPHRQKRRSGLPR